VLPPETAAAFFGASVVLALAPGPDNIFVLTQSALQGRRAGLLVTLGLCTGLLVHTTAVTLGVAAILQASTAAFTALKLAGAAYLLYLAGQAFRAGAAAVPAGGRPLSAGRLYRRGIIMNVTNPKVSIFFLALLPQFADPGRGRVPLQLIALGGIFLVATLAIFGGVALAAGSLGERLSGSPRAQRAMQRVAGLVFLGLAVRLAVGGRH
jgi:threonine/homoserine/homoserine lactone efflux protein